MIRPSVRSSLLWLAALAAPGAASAQVQLEFKFTEGKTSTYESIIRFDQSLMINGQEIKTRSSKTTLSTTRVGEARDNGVIPITQTIDSIKAELSLPGGIELTIDSKDPKVPDGELPQLTAIRRAIQALDGMSFRFLVDKEGQVQGVEGTAEAIPKDLDPQIAEELRQQLDPQSLTREYRQEYGTFPNEPVQKNQTWQRTESMNLGSGQTLTFDKTYSYLGAVDRGGKTLDRIGVSSDSVSFAMENPGSPLQVKNSDLKVASSRGEVLFDREAGQVVESTSSTRVTGSLVLAAGGQDLPAELDLSVTTVTALKPSK